MSRLGASFVATLLVTAAWLPGCSLADETKATAWGAPAAAPSGHDHQDEEDPREAIKEHLLKQTPAPPPIQGGSEAIARYVQELRESPSDRMRMTAGKSLAGLASQGDSTAMAELVAVLKDKDAGRSRMFVAMALRYSKSSEAVGPLLDVLRDQTLPVELRKQAALALGQLGDPRALQDLLRATDDPAPDVRYYAAVGLGLEDFVKLTPLLPVLLKVAKDRELSTFRRARAVQQALVMGDESIVDPLVDLLRTEPRSPDIRPASADPTAGMFAAMMNKQRNVRAKIAAALGMYGDGRVVKPLLTVMSTAGDDRNFTEAAQKALDRVARRSGPAPFVAELKGPDPAVRRQAVLVLASLKNVDQATVRKGLQEAVKDSDPAVREAASAELASELGASEEKPSGAGVSDAGSAKKN